MKSKKVSVKLPLGIYDELMKIAEACDWTFEDVLLTSVRHGMPPSLNKVPTAFHEDLIALNAKDDMELLQITEGDTSDIKELTDQQKKADFVMLRRTYALSLLKWRGHPVPTAFEL